MKKIAFILLLTILTFSCNNANESNVQPTCGVENTIKDLAWLKSEIEQRDQDDIVDWQYNYIMQASFEKQDIFIYGNCDPTVNYVPLIYNCSGEEIGYVGDDKFPSDLLSKGTVIWKGQGNQCDL